MKLHTMRRGHLVTGSGSGEVHTFEGLTSAGECMITKAGVFKYCWLGHIHPHSTPMFAGVGDWVKLSGLCNLQEVVFIHYRFSTPRVGIQLGSFDQVLSYDRAGSYISGGRNCVVEAVYSDKEGKHCISHDKPEFYLTAMETSWYELRRTDSDKVVCCHSDKTMAQDALAKLNHTTVSK